MSVKIEIAKLSSIAPQADIEDCIWKLIESKKIHKNTVFNIPSSKKHPELDQFQGQIHSIVTNDIPARLERSDVQFCFYEFSDHHQPETETMQLDNSEEQVTSSIHWILPNKSDLHGMWESLVYEDNLKENLLSFSETMLMFSKLNIDQNIVSCNRLILLHGPPGTGKTSLAKALAQKLSIQMNDSYQFTHLFEINSHSLFSKWFSESGKLVMKMFEQIQEVIDLETSLVCVLIDEVESIVHSRAAISDAEPSDALRVVNSVLTELDRIKKYPNVLIITTSNLTATIDLAFLDRADIVTFIGQPSVEAIYKIIASSIVELATKGVIHPDSPEDGREDFNIDTIESYESFHDLQSFHHFTVGNIMMQVCKEAFGLSGRTLRKLPFLAHALYIKKKSSTLREFLIAMRSAIAYHKRNKQNMTSNVVENGDPKIC